MIDDNTVSYTWQTVVEHMEYCLCHRNRRRDQNQLRHIISARSLTTSHNQPPQQSELSSLCASRHYIIGELAPEALLLAQCTDRLKLSQSTLKTVSQCG